MTDKVENEEKVVEKNKFAKDLCFDKIVWIFMISCIVGFLVETLWCLIKHGYIESRQSLVWGPFSVAYGMGAVVLTLALYKVKDAPVWKVFGVSFIVGTITEYICSLGSKLCLALLRGITAICRLISTAEYAFFIPAFGGFWEYFGLRQFIL